MNLRICSHSIVLLLVLASLGVAQSGASINKRNPDSSLLLDAEGAIVRGDPTIKSLALVFTGDEFADGANTIAQILKKHGVKASFFLTGRFYRNAAFQSSIRQLKRDGHYLGAHSDEHLLYCDWNRREQLLIGRKKFEQDLKKNYEAMAAFGISKGEARFFLPPFEWYNRTITNWTEAMGLRLINFTPGTRSNADYTTPEMKNYVSSDEIMTSIKDYETKDPTGLNGFILLLHIGVAPERKDKFYDRLDEMIEWLNGRKYRLVLVDQLLHYRNGSGSDRMLRDSSALAGLCLKSCFWRLGIGRCSTCRRVAAA